MSIWTNLVTGFIAGLGAGVVFTALHLKSKIRFYKHFIESRICVADMVRLRSMLAVDNRRVFGRAAVVVTQEAEFIDPPILPIKQRSLRGSKVRSEQIAARPAPLPEVVRIRRHILS